MTSNFHSIGQLARQSGVSPHTLRYYEAAGILRPAGRGANGHRRYVQADRAWLEFVLRLKQTGMPLADIRAYADLRAAGEITLQSRLSMLKLHRQRLTAQMAELATCAQALDDKMRIYRRMIVQSSAPKEKGKK